MGNTELLAIFGSVERVPIWSWQQIQIIPLVKYVLGYVFTKPTEHGGIIERPTRPLSLPEKDLLGRGFQFSSTEVGTQIAISGTVG